VPVGCRPAGAERAPAVPGPGGGVPTRSRST